MKAIFAKLVNTYHLDWRSTLTLLIGVLLMGLLTSPSVFLILALCIASTTIPQVRRLSLFAACLVNLFFLNSFIRTFDISPLHFIPFLVFNIVFVLAIDRLEALRRQSILTALLLIVVLGLIQRLMGHLGLTVRDAVLAATPIVASFWAYMNYIKLPTTSLTFIERVVWLRPFWYRWVLPYGSNREIIDALRGPIVVKVEEITQALRVLALISVGMFLFENLVFEKNEVFARVAWLPHVFNFPLVYRDGYAVAMAAFEGQSGGSQLRQSLYYLAVQSAATIQFLFIIALYSTVAITTARFAGFKIDLHVRDFWNAKNFGDFYFRTNHHFSLLIRAHFLPKLARVKVRCLPDSVRQALVIAISVFIVSSISMYIGRGHFLGGKNSFENRLAAYFLNYHYATLTALVCAMHVFARKWRISPAGKVIGGLWQAARVMAYFLIFQFTLIFGFHFLKTAPEVKLQYAATILKLFRFDTYL